MTSSPASRFALVFVLLASGCTSWRQAAGGLSVASGLVAVGGAGYVVYAGTEAPPQASVAPYVLGTGAAGLMSATFFALAAHLLGESDRRHGADSADGADDAAASQETGSPSRPAPRCYNAEGRSITINSNETCSQRGLRYAPPQRVP